MPVVTSTNGIENSQNKAEQRRETKQGNERKSILQQRVNPKNEKFIKRKISYMLPAERNNRSIGQQKE
jgi:hypothetical protein